MDLEMDLRNNFFLLGPANAGRTLRHPVNAATVRREILSYDTPIRRVLLYTTVALKWTAAF
jgi:hypothetical protein